jgi:uncharacterized membrane protein
MAKRYGWLLLILLAASSLRLIGLSNVPPGLTHDEADHGLDAWGVVNGDRPVYFTVGYGREPFFDYATAGLMTFLGPSYLAGRLTSVYLSLIMIAGTYAWTSRAFGYKTALLTAAGLAVSFWAVMTGRQALRSIALPALFVLVVFFFWQAMKYSMSRDEEPEGDSHFIVAALRAPLSNFLLAGAFLGLTFYSYFPARILWLLFPAMLMFLALFDRRRFHGVWRGTLLMLLVAAIITVPLFLFLASNPSVEARVIELSGPLKSAAQGDFRPLLQNTIESTLLFISKGDSQWRYNIPGRALLSPLMAALFFIGLGIALWRIVAGIRDRRQLEQSAAAFFIIIWLLLGLSPALVTGPALSTTRIIGLQPVLYIFPALTLAAALQIRNVPKRLAYGLTAIFFLALAVQTVRDYFFIWANAPEVRLHYETTLVSTINYLNENGRGPVAISTTTPGRYHSPAVAQLTLNNQDVDLRWFDGQYSILVPQGGEGMVVFSGFAPLSPFLEPYFSGTFVEELALRPTDLDRPLTIYSTDAKSLREEWQHQFDDTIQAPVGATMPVQFGDAAELLGYALQTPVVAPGDTVRLATLWRVKRPLDEAVIFTHVLGSDGKTLAQTDRLDAPSIHWVAGDLFIQLHEIALPEQVTPGEYPMLLGLYTRQDSLRLPVIIDGATAADHLRLPPLTVSP